MSWPRQLWLRGSCGEEQDPSSPQDASMQQEQHLERRMRDLSSLVPHPATRRRSTLPHRRGEHSGIEQPWVTVAGESQLTAPHPTLCCNTLCKGERCVSGQGKPEAVQRLGGAHNAQDWEQPQLGERPRDQSGKQWTGCRGTDRWLLAEGSGPSPPPLKPKICLTSSTHVLQAWGTAQQFCAASDTTTTVDIGGILFIFFFVLFCIFKILFRALSFFLFCSTHLPSPFPQLFLLIL